MASAASNSPTGDDNQEQKQFVVGVTGASGSILAHRLTNCLLRTGNIVHLVASKTGRLVAHDELEIPEGTRSLFPDLEDERLVEWQAKNFFAPFASGSAAIDGMALIPCSMSTLACVASGISDNLIRRAAEVTLKERRALVVVPREAPLTEIHLDNMRRIASQGAVVIPPVLTFYQHPGDSVLAQVDFIVSRVLDHLGVDNQLFTRWGS